MRTPDKPAFTTDYIEDHCIPIPESGCWLWELSGLNADDGDDSSVTDRLIYECFYGPIPLNKHLVHDCQLDCCVNPRHMHLE